VKLTPFDLHIDAKLFSSDNRTRTKGCHLTDIVKAIEQGIGHGRNPRAMGEKQLENYRLMGFLWEDVLTHQINAERSWAISPGLVRPGEIELDGIIMTPDAVDFAADPGPVLEEWKVTWHSMARDLESENWHWFVQMKAYCHALKLTRANLRILYVNGDYRPTVPKPQGYAIEFTQRELTDNFSMILNHARSRGWLPPRKEAV
jgi:hypothetical protein